MDFCFCFADNWSSIWQLPIIGASSNWCWWQGKGMPILHDAIFQHFCWVKSAEYLHHLQLCNNKQHASLTKMLFKYILGMCNLMVSNQNAAIWKMQNVPSCRPRAIRKILKPACNWNNWQLQSLIKLQMFHFIRGLISRGSTRMLAGRVKNKTLQMLGWLEEEKVICRI